MGWGSSRPSGSIICLEDLARNHAYGFDLLQQRMQTKISKQNGAGGEVQEKSGTSFPGSSPGRVALMYLIPKAMSLTTQVNCYQLGSSAETRGPECLWDATI